MTDIADDFSTTTTFLAPGASLTSDIDTFGDIDVIETSFTAGLAYVVEVSTPVASMDLSVSVLDGLGTSVASNSGINGSPVSIAFPTVLATDTFYVEIQDSGANDTGEYTLTLNADDTILDSVSTGTFVTGSTPFTSEIDVFGDVDVVGFGLVEGFSYGLSVSTTTTSLDLVLRLQDGSGSTLAANSQFNGTTAFLSYEATTTDNFFAQISDVSANDIGDYTLILDDSDTILNSVATTEMLPATGSLTSNIDVTGDIDVIGFEMTEGLSYGLSVSTSGSALDLILRLLDGSELTLASNSQFAGATASLSFESSLSDTYYAQISDVGANEIGDYTLTLDDSDTILNSVATTEFLDGSNMLTSNIDVDGDVDVIGFDLTEGLSYGLSVSTTGSALDLILRLQDGLESTLASNSQFSGATASLSYAATASDTFFAQISDSGGNETGDYTLILDDSDTILNSTATTEVMDVGTCFESVIDVNGDVDMIAFDLVAGVTYDFLVDTESTGLDLVFRLQDATAANLVTGTSFSGASVSRTYTAVTTQTAYIQISDSGGNETGGYSIIVTADTNEDLSGAGQDAKLFGGDGNDTLSGFAGDDTLVGGEDDDVLRGGLGSDSLMGDAGADVIFGGDDADYIDGGAGSDTVDAGAGEDTVLGGDDADLLKGGQDNDSIEGGLGNDTLRAGAGEDEAFGGEGDDEISGSDGADTLYGEAGNDVVLGDAQQDVLFGGDGMDTLRGGGDNDVLHGDADADVLFGSAGDDTLNGGVGDDTLEGGTQRDALFGDEDNDVLRGEDGADTLYGGLGDDTLVGGNENDLLIGGAGVDTLRGQANNDTFVFESVTDSAFGAADLIDGIDGVGAAGGDRIDLSLIDADIATAGDQSFTFIGAATTATGLAGGAGTLWTETVGTQTRLYGIVDGDGLIDLSIRINDGTVLDSDYLASDLVL